MAENKLADLSTDFAVKILKLTGRMKGHYSLVNQLERSATSIGANIAEAQRGQSKADFNAKMCIALKEANETEYWLKLLYRTEYLSQSQYRSMNADLQELIGILTAICRTTNTGK